MTTKQTVKAVQKQFPGASVFCTINYRAYNHIPGVEKEYEVYAGNTQQALARGKGASWIDAVSNIKLV